jgi:hypothetical protein
VILTKHTDPSETPCIPECVVFLTKHTDTSETPCLPECVVFLTKHTDTSATPMYTGVCALLNAPIQLQPHIGRRV